MLTQSRLKELLHYDPLTGIFTRIKSTMRPDLAGTVAGCVMNTDYSIIYVDQVRYLAHHLAWLYMTGELPNEFIDHKDRKKSNNIFSNLREAGSHENQRNVGLKSSNTSGVKGVHFHKANKKWIAQSFHDKKPVYLGSFKEKADAEKKVREWRENMHGEFAAHE